MKRFVLHPGYVTSLRDWDRHFIGAPKLARLYGVPLAECAVADGRPGLSFQLAPNAVHLYPRADGRYELPR